MANPSKAKGYRGEREVLDMLQRIVSEEYRARGLVPPELSRSPNGRDIRGLPFVAIEVKYREQVSLGQWWEQTKRNAPAGAEPILIWRSNYEPWRVRMFGYLRFAEATTVPWVNATDAQILAGPKPARHVKTPVDITCEAFLTWFRERVKESVKVALS